MEGAGRRSTRKRTREAVNSSPEQGKKQQKLSFVATPTDSPKSHPRGALSRSQSVLASVPPPPYRQEGLHQNKPLHPFFQSPTAPSSLRRAQSTGPTSRSLPTPIESALPPVHITQDQPPLPTPPSHLTIPIPSPKAQESPEHTNIPTSQSHVPFSVPVYRPSVRDDHGPQENEKEKQEDRGRLPWESMKSLLEDMGQAWGWTRETNPSPGPEDLSSLFHERYYQRSSHSDTKDILWTERYRPQALSECFLHPAIAEHLHRWLHALTGGGGSSFDDYRSYRAIVLHSPEPWGKSSLLQCAAEVQRVPIVEIHSGLLRSSRTIRSLEEATQSQHLDLSSSGQTTGESGSGHSKILLFEDIDVCFPDEGGFYPTINTLIGKSKQPLVMTCARPPTLLWEREDVLRFSLTPSPHLYPQLIERHIAFICLAEFQRIPRKDAVQRVCQMFSYDLRRILLALQFWHVPPGSRLITLVRGCDVLPLPRDHWARGVSACGWTALRSTPLLHSTSLYPSLSCANQEGLEKLDENRRKWENWKAMERLSEGLEHLSACGVWMQRWEAEEASVSSCYQMQVEGTCRSYPDPDYRACTSLPRMNPLNDPSQDLLLCEQMILTYTSTTFHTFASTLPTLDGENDSLRAAQQAQHTNLSYHQVAARMFPRHDVGGKHVQYEYIHTLQRICALEKEREEAKQKRRWADASSPRPVAPSSSDGILPSLWADIRAHRFLHHVSAFVPAEARTALLHSRLPVSLHDGEEEEQSPSCPPLSSPPPGGDAQHPLIL